jgi:DNA-binding IclR family transcriptional regulator
LQSKGSPPLERYFKALESIAVSVDGLSASDVAECCDLPVATAHRLLQNLRRSDLIARSGGARKEYQLGERLLRLLHAGSDAGWLSIAVQPILDRLADELGDTCYLARLVGHKVMSVAWAPPSGGLRAHVIPGHVLAPHVAASAKAILAFQSQDLIDKALAEPLPKLTPKTKTRPKAVEQDYRTVREAGYALCWDEMEVGMGAIAVPVRLPDVGVIYSLGLAGLIDRLTRRSVADTVEVLHAAADPIARALQIRRPAPRAGVRSRKAASPRVRSSA